mmetsp:Transcript_21218/g.46241  ORF Transcript_21218/g.46241 Transcript_21218/m.46241 type:complete len:200 (-) Transcript_21218:790-1389(-)
MKRPASRHDWTLPLKARRRRQCPCLQQPSPQGRLCGAGSPSQWMGGRNCRRRRWRRRPRSRSEQVSSTPRIAAHRTQPSPLERVPYTQLFPNSTSEPWARPRPRSSGSSPRSRRRRSRAPMGLSRTGRRRLSASSPLRTGASSRATLPRSTRCTGSALRSRASATTSCSSPPRRTASSLCGTLSPPTRCTPSRSARAGS